LQQQDVQTLDINTNLAPLVAAGFSFLTPNYRLARRIKRQWDEFQSGQGNKLWPSLKAAPLESWMMARWQQALAAGVIAPETVLSEGQALEVWQRVIEQAQAASGQYSLIQPAAAARQAQQARENMLRWQLDLTQDHIAQQFRLDPDCAAFLDWARRFDEELQRRNWCTASDCYTQLLEVSGQLPRDNLALLDFEDVPPLFQACIDALAQKPQYLQSSSKEARCVVTAWPDSRSELAAVARWARNAGPHERMGIVLQSMEDERPQLEYLLRREFDCLGQGYRSLPVNFSAGITLDRAPVVRAGLEVLQFCLPTMPLSLVTRLLQSRFIDVPEAEPRLRVNFLQRLYDFEREQLAVADIRHQATRVNDAQPQPLELGQRLLELSQLRELGHSLLPSGWVEVFCRVLELWRWPGRGTLDSLEYQQLEQWYKTLEDFAAFDDVSGKLAFDKALKLLVRCAASHVSQPQTADANIQVLGPLEAAGLQFDQLWLTGMQANSWPAPARPNPLIPHSFQKQLAMPHATPQREWEYSAGLMAQYRSSCSVLHASYAHQKAGVPELPSALLADFEQLVSDPVALVAGQWEQQRQDAAYDRGDDNTAPPLDAEEMSTLAGGAGLLEDQSQCPFRAFARRRLNARGLAEPVAGMSAADRGSLLHDALFCLFSHIGSSAELAQLRGEQQQQLIENAVEEAMLKLPASGPRAVTPAWRELEWGRLHNLLQQWLELEGQRTEYVVESLEEGIELTLPPLQIRMRVDRIDRLADGRQVIIDYKSGSPKLQDWLGERPASPQLLLYGSAVEQAPAAITFARVRTDDCSFVGAGDAEVGPGVRTDIEKLVRGGWEIENWQQLNERWQQQLQSLADEFVAGNAAVDPMSGACTYCELSTLCRIDMPVGGDA
jgi:ATP-dependent helicase/nuclease subunit B